MITLKTAAEIDAIAEAGKVVARALTAVRDHAAEGVSLRELDAVAASVISDSGAKPAFLGYHPRFAPGPFPGVICASVNDAAVHGVPNDRRLADGDLLGVDCGAFVDGWCADSAFTFPVGQPRPDDLTLVKDTQAGLDAGIAAAQPGNRLGDIGAAVSAHGRSLGYGLMAHHGGHGIGRAMHEAPYVPNEAKPGSGILLRPGLVIAVEPIFVFGGGDAYRTDADGWTNRAADGSRAAHMEHTIAVTDSGPRILTSRDDA